MGVKSRIVSVLLWDDHGAVKGRQFSKDRRIGAMEDRIRVVERRDVDELIILDVAATPNNRGPRFDQVTRLCENLFMPVTIGGGVRNEHDVARIIRGGADKVAVNTAALETPGIIRDAARRFGNQAIVVGIDCLAGNVFSRCGTRHHDLGPESWAKQVEDLGAGEILLTSIDRDGTMEGYDLPLIESVSRAVSIPVVAAGGCGSYEHMEQAFNAGAHAVAVGAMFQFTDTTPRGAARYLKEHGFNVRL